MPAPRESGTGDALQGLERDLAGALHEVSNALTVVLGWLEAARHELTDAHRDDGLSAARRAVEIAWSRAQLGRGIARRAIGAETNEPEEDASLPDVARDAVVGVEHEASRRGMKIDIV